MGGHLQQCLSQARFEKGEVNILCLIMSDKITPNFTRDPLPNIFCQTRFIDSICGATQSTLLCFLAYNIERGYNQYKWGWFKSDYVYYIYKPIVDEYIQYQGEWCLSHMVLEVPDIETISFTMFHHVLPCFTPYIVPFQSKVIFSAISRSNPHSG